MRKSIVSEIIDIPFLSIVRNIGKQSPGVRQFFFPFILCYTFLGVMLQTTWRREKSKQSLKLFLFDEKLIYRFYIRKNIFHVKAKSPFHLHLQSVNQSPAGKKDVAKNKRSSFWYFIHFFLLFCKWNIR